MFRSLGLPLPEDPRVASPAPLPSRLPGFAATGARCPRNAKGIRMVSLHFAPHPPQKQIPAPSETPGAGTFQARIRWDPAGAEHPLGSHGGSSHFLVCHPPPPRPVLRVCPPFREASGLALRFPCPSRDLHEGRGRGYGCPGVLTPETGPGTHQDTLRPCRVHTWSSLALSPMKTFENGNKEALPK